MSRTRHRCVYRLATGPYPCRHGNESVGLGNGYGYQFLESAHYVSEAVGKRDAEMLVFQGRGNELFDSLQSDIELSSVEGDDDFNATDGDRVVAAGVVAEGCDQ